MTQSKFSIFILVNSLFFGCCLIAVVCLFFVLFLFCFYCVLCVCVCVWDTFGFLFFYPGSMVVCVLTCHWAKSTALPNVFWYVSVFFWFSFCLFLFHYLCDWLVFILSYFFFLVSFLFWGKGVGGERLDRYRAFVSWSLLWTMCWCFPFFIKITY